MALNVKLQGKQTQKLGQSLSMTPQLVQSIKLLQMSGIELQKHVEEEIEKNPLLELTENRPSREDSQTQQIEDHSTLVSAELDTSQKNLEDKLGTNLDNEFDGDNAKALAHLDDKNYLKSSNSTDFSNKSMDANNLEEYIPEKINLRDHLSQQLALCNLENSVRTCALEIIDNLDEDGFFRGKLHMIAIEKGLQNSELEEALKTVQGFEPTGIAARDLGECLAIQLKELNRYDPAMARLLENLPLLAKRDYQQLAQICGVSPDEVLDMADEIKALEPRPARQFDGAIIQTIIPDVTVVEKNDGSFVVELNNDVMPKVLINQTYKAILDNSAERNDETNFIVDCLQSANWLVRSIEQRASTILKVTSEIVRQQDAFFAHGISHLKPMSLKQVADAIKMHESTVSRVTTNKYVLTNRGMFELKFFFTAAIGSVDQSQSHSAEAVRERIKNLIDNESINKILSDDAIVERLQSEGIEIARRTVAKYRENLQIASSVQRRREKKAEQARADKDGTIHHN